VPVAATMLADVGAADADPLVSLGGGKHLAQKFAVGLLDEGPLGEGAVGFGDAGGERVAHALQLAEVEDARRPGGGDPVRDNDPAEALGDEGAKLELEPRDLPAQLRPCPRLVDLQPSVLCHPLGYKGQPVDLSPVEQIRHKQILRGLEGRGGNP
jgi:hypothetical protein